MFDLSLHRRCRAALTASVFGAALVAAPAVASAEPRDTHATIAFSTDDTGTDTDSDSDTDTDELLAACPVGGAATFEDSWGWPRSGGRSHEGVDMMGDRGTPILAVRDGEAVFKQNRLGGNAVWLTASNGDKFYYAHLDGFEGESRTVDAGELIGYLGSTGNAGGPHLHFETLPGGEVENPYPHTVAACVPTPEELAELAAQEANPSNDPTVRERFLSAR